MLKLKVTGHKEQDLKTRKVIKKIDGKKSTNFTGAHPRLKPFMLSSNNSAYVTTYQ